MILALCEGIQRPSMDSPHKGAAVPGCPLVVLSHDDFFVVSFNFCWKNSRVVGYLRRHNGDITNRVYWSYIASCTTVHGNIKSFAPRKCDSYIKSMIFKLMLGIYTLSISCKIALRRMPQDLTDDSVTLVQVMAWCRQATSHYQCWLRIISPLWGHQATRSEAITGTNDLHQWGWHICNWLSLRCLVPWINPLPLVCWSTFWKFSLKW